MTNCEIIAELEVKSTFDAKEVIETLVNKGFLVAWSGIYNNKSHYQIMKEKTNEIDFSSD